MTKTDSKIIITTSKVNLKHRKWTKLTRASGLYCSWPTALQPTSMCSPTFSLSQLIKMWRHGQWPEALSFKHWCSTYPSSISFAHVGLLGEVDNIENATPFTILIKHADKQSVKHSTTSNDFWRLLCCQMFRVRLGLGTKTTWLGQGLKSSWSGLATKTIWLGLGTHIIWLGRGSKSTWLGKHVWG